MLQFAVATEEITPTSSVYLAGFAARQHQSTGVHDDIFAKAVLLRGNRTLLVITLDVLGGDHSFVSGVKNALSRKFHLKEEEILINFSHTHASVYLTGEDPATRRGRYSMSLKAGYPGDRDTELDYTEDVAFYHKIKQVLQRIVSRCFCNLTKGKLEYAAGDTNISVSRRVVTDTGVGFAPNADAVVDREVNVFRLLNREGKLRVILFSHGCHPTSMNNYEVSAEFVGHACRLLERRYPGATAVFLQGCAAEIKPRGSVGADGKFKRCTFAEMEQIGAEFAADVQSVLNDSSFRTIEPNFKAELKKFHLYSQKGDAHVYEQKLQDEATPVEMRPVYRRLLEAMRTGRARARLPFSVMMWHLDDTTRFVAMEGEIANEYSRLIKQLFKEDSTVVLGYSNGVFTYVPTERMVAEGGYEGERAPLMHGFEAPFIPETEAMILGQVLRTELSIRGDFR